MKALWLLAWCTCASSLFGQDWPVFRGNEAATGVSSCKIPDEPKLLWEYQVPKGAFEGTPVVVGDRIYIGDADGKIYCLNLQNGQELWKVETGSGFVSAAAVRDPFVIIADYDGKVRCLDVQDGKERWTYEAGGGVDAGINFYGDCALLTSESGFLHSLRLVDGSVNWTYEARDQLRCSPTVVGNRTFLGGCDGQLHIVDLDTGKLAGELLPLDGPTGCTPAVFGDLAVVPTQQGGVYGMDWKAMKPKWVFQDGQRRAEIRSSPAINEDLVIVTTYNRNVLALKRESGELAWEATLRKRSDASPVICDGRVWVASVDGRFMSLRLSDGVQTWMTELGGSFLSSPAFAQNRIVLASDNGSIFCLGVAEEAAASR